MTDPQGSGIALGGPGPRLAGYIVDILIQLAAIFVLVIVFTLVGQVVPALGVLGLYLSFFVVQVVYWPYFWATRGQTPGMKYTKVKVVDEATGGPVSPGKAILRLIGYWISGAVFLLGFIWVLIDKRQRGWFDLIAGTIVIKA
jgi:uncharacterized RDD family membrane protein YckC